MSSNFNEDWPPFPETIPGNPKLDRSTQLELRKLLYQSQLEFYLNQQSATDKQSEIFSTYFYSSEQALDNARFDVIKGALNRIQNKAEYIQRSAGVIATVYTAILGFTFDIKKSAPFSLPIRGLIPTTFLGLSIFLTAIYLSYISRPKDSVILKSHPVPRQQLLENINHFNDWVLSTVFNRANYLQSAVISLGFSIISLPIAFLILPDWIAWIGAAIGILLAFVIPLWYSIWKSLATLHNKMSQNIFNESN